MYSAVPPVFTNVSTPRSEIVRRHLYEGTLVRRGATIGANATIICGITIGRYALIAAGAVVTHDIPDYVLVQGIPARGQQWMSRHGHRLERKDGQDTLVDGVTGWRYRLREDGGLRCLDWPEDEPLPREA